MRTLAAILALVCLMAMLVLAGGCVKEFTVCDYQARGVVEEPEPPHVEVAGSPTAEAIAAVAPWQPLFDFLAGVLPTMGQTRRAAIQERMNYTEERQFSIFSMKFQEKEK